MLCYQLLVINGSSLTAVNDDQSWSLLNHCELSMQCTAYVHGWPPWSTKDPWDPWPIHSCCCRKHHRHGIHRRGHSSLTNGYGWWLKTEQSTAIYESVVPEMNQTVQVLRVLKCIWVIFDSDPMDPQLFEGYFHHSQSWWFPHQKSHHFGHVDSNSHGDSGSHRSLCWGSCIRLHSPDLPSLAQRARKSNGPVIYVTIHVAS